jgi:hypothetical protein
MEKLTRENPFQIIYCLKIVFEVLMYSSTLLYDMLMDRKYDAMSVYRIIGPNLTKVG